MIANIGAPASLEVNARIKLDLLPALKGAPVSILFALHFSRKPMSNRKLMQVARYSDKSISAGLEILKDKGIARKITGGWVLAIDYFEVGKFPTPELEIFHPHGNSPSTTTAINNPQEFSREEEVDKTSRKNSALAALYKAGIFNPKALELAELDHVTEELVKAHADYGKLNGEYIGLVITRI